MPKPSKKSQLQEVQKLLAKAAYLLAEEVQDWEKGYVSLQTARALIAEMNGDVETARSARAVVAHIEHVKSTFKETPLHEVLRHARQN